jgi:hypothetical protein
MRPWWSVSFYSKYKYTRNVSLCFLSILSHFMNFRSSHQSFLGLYTLRPHQHCVYDKRTKGSGIDYSITDKGLWKWDMIIFLTNYPFKLSNDNKICQDKEISNVESRNEIVSYFFESNRSHILNPERLIL